QPVGKVCVRRIRAVSREEGILRETEKVLGTICSGRALRLQCKDALIHDRRDRWIAAVLRRQLGKFGRQNSQAAAGKIEVLVLPDVLEAAKEEGLVPLNRAAKSATKHVTHQLVAAIAGRVATLNVIHGVQSAWIPVIPKAAAVKLIGAALV